MKEWVVSSQESGMKLVAFLYQKFGGMHSAKALKGAIDSHLCRINGSTERFASVLVGTGDVVEFNDDKLLQKRPTKVKVEPSHIIFEDSDLLVYDKPSGISSEGHELLDAIHCHCSKAHLLHRLDRETTGLLMFSKSPEAHASMLNQFKKGLIQKTYLAIADGVPSQKSGIVDNYLGKQFAYQGQAFWGEVSKAKGLHAVTRWQVEHKGKDCALLKCFPETGRTHQIRVHLAGLGHPILGDYHYGKRFRCTYRPPRCMLHASEITFTHPSTSQPCTLQAPLPDDFSDALHTLIKCSL